MTALRVAARFKFGSSANRLTLGATLGVAPWQRKEEFLKLLLRTASSGIPPSAADEREAPSRADKANIKIVEIKGRNQIMESPKLCPF
jgi:hypothetical protein